MASDRGNPSGDSMKMRLSVTDSAGRVFVGEAVLTAAGAAPAKSRSHHDTQRLDHKATTGVAPRCCTGSYFASLPKGVRKRQRWFSEEIHSSFSPSH